MGLDAGLNYRATPDWDRWVVEQTDGVGVDLVVEVGGMGTVTRSMRAVRVGGTIAQIGVLSAASEMIPLTMILHKQTRIQGIYVGSRADFVAMNAFIEKHGLRPVLTSRPWSEAREALRTMEAATHFGKLVVEAE